LKLCICTNNMYFFSWGATHLKLCICTNNMYFFFRSGERHTEAFNAAGKMGYGKKVL
jgi:hypothetical protein